MHASSGRSLGKKGAAGALAALLTAGCTAGSSDQATLHPPANPVTTVATGPTGPAVTFSGAGPTVAGHAAASAALRRAAPAGCAPSLERSDRHLVSVLWRCGNHLASATVTLDGRPLALGDILTGAYASYLSSAAESQFQVEGVAHPVTTDLSTWYLTPAALAVAFPAGIVSYPLASLSTYLKDPASL